MELRLRNVAKIEHADLKLDGITVIAGENNVGKSTVGKVVFALFNSLVDIEDKIGAQKKDLLLQLYNKLLHKRALDWKVNFKDGMEFVNYKIPLSNSNDMFAEKEQEILIEQIRNLKSDALDPEIVEQFQEEAKRIFDLPVDRLKKSVVSRYFARVFYDEINNIYNLDSKAIIEACIKGQSIQLEFEQNYCTHMEQQVEITNEAVYLDNPFVLNRLNNGISGSDEMERVVINKLQKKMDAVEDVVQYNLIVDKTQEIVDRISKVVDGSLASDKMHTYYYRENGNNKLNANNISAGLKAFIIIKTLLEKGELKEKDILILDEPEIHLHPEWQMVYAEVIILLQKIFDLTILLTTHSAHFLDALHYYARLHKVETKCNYYLAKNGESGSVLENVTGDISKIYSKLVDPSILLDKLKYKMEEDADE